jgi:hypothetical protein
MDKYGATAHPAAASAIGRTHLMPSIPFHLNESTTHFCANPIPSRSMHHDLASSHLGAKVGADISPYHDASTCHPGADPFDSSNVPFDHYVLVRGVAAHRKIFGKRLLPISVLHHQAFDFMGGLACKLGGHDTVGLNRNVRVGFPG